MSVFGSELYGSGDAVPFALELIGNFEGCGTAEGLRPVFDDKKLGVGRLLSLVSVHPCVNLNDVGGCIKLLQSVDLILLYEPVCNIAKLDEFGVRRGDYFNFLKYHVAYVLILNSESIESAAGVWSGIFFNENCWLQIPQNEICLHSQIFQLSNEHNDCSYADNGCCPSTGRSKPFTKCRSTVCNDSTCDQTQETRGEAQYEGVPPKIVRIFHLISPHHNHNLPSFDGFGKRRAA